MSGTVGRQRSRPGNVGRFPSTQRPQPSTGAYGSTMQSMANTQYSQWGTSSLSAKQNNTFLASNNGAAGSGNPNRTATVARQTFMSDQKRKVLTFEDDKGPSDSKTSTMATRIQNMLSKQKFHNRSQRSNMKNNKLDAAQILKEATYYFDKNPTYIKETEIGDQVQINLKKYIESTTNERLPYFGYAPINFEEEENGIRSSKSNMMRYLLGEESPPKSRRDKEQTMPFRQALLTKRKEDRIRDHVLKCFTFGKKVRRQLDEESQQASRVDILKKRFQRLTLLRPFFSVAKRNTMRKFKYPVEEDAEQFNKKAQTIYDDVQYCVESDLEELKPQQDKRSEAEIRLKKLLKKQKTQSLDLDNLKDKQRLDLQILKNFDMSSVSDNAEGSDNDTFKHIDTDCSRSAYSTPRQRVQKEMLAYDRIMPFDFITHRKARQFFREDIEDINAILLDPKAIGAKKGQNESVNKEYDDEDEDQREVPIMTERLKSLLRIGPKKRAKKHKKVIKGAESSNSDEEKFERMNYGQKAQNSQTRDNHNELLSLFFQRTQQRNIKTKREMLEKIVNFKQNLSPDQVKVLKNRSFVIVDMKSLHSNKMMQIGVRKRKQGNEDYGMGQTKDNDLKETAESYVNRQLDYIYLTKRHLMKEKINFRTRNSSISPVPMQPILPTASSKNDISAAEITSLPNISSIRSIAPHINVNYSSQGGATADQLFGNKQNPSKSMMSQISGVSPNSQNCLTSKQASMTKASSDAPTNQMMFNRLSQRTVGGFSASLQSQKALEEERSASKINKFAISSASLLDQQQQQNQDYAQGEDDPTKIYSKAYNIINVKMALRDLPYQNVDQALLINSMQSKKFNYWNKPQRIRGFLVDKLKRKSILNSDLFKDSAVDYRVKTAFIIDRINATLGLNIPNKKEHHIEDGQDDLIDEGEEAEGEQEEEDEGKQAQSLRR